jgi:sugar phosphate isomerase/epimerase/HEAT repeat protein
MKRYTCLVVLTCLLAIFLSASVCLAAEREALLPNEFFAMHTALVGADRGHAPDRADVAKLAELGYAGLAPGFGDLADELKLLDEKKLKLYAIYSTVEVDRDQYSYSPRFKDGLDPLKGRDTVLWLMIKSKCKPSDTAAFGQAVTMTREVADLAAAQGLRVAVYPHFGSFCERMEDAVRLVEKVDRKNVGVTLNLCHWLRADGPESMQKVMKLALPHLFLVSINGADRDGKNWIQPLDSGTFDVAAFLGELHRLGYTGPIGLQGAGVGKTVPPYENLTRSMAAWKRLSKAAMASAAAATSKPTAAAPEASKKTTAVPAAGKKTTAARTARKPAPVTPAVAQDWKEICARLKTYTLGRDDEADWAAFQHYLQTMRPEERAPIESALVALLRDASVSAEAKQFICRQAQFFKSDEAVTVLAQLQAQPQFSFMACYALQRMPSAHAAAALRELFAQRTGRQRIDVICALGGLRDQQAVGMLAGELHSDERPIAAAAVGALGMIGGAEAEKALAAFEPAAPAELKPAVADARLRCAAHMPAEQAAEIYRAYLKSPLPPQRMVAFVGLLGQQTPRRTAILLDAIQGSDAALKSVALRQARSGGGAELTAALAAILEKLAPIDQAAVLDVLNERGDPSALPAVLKLAGSSEENVRCAALAVCGRLGDSGQVDLLIQAAIREKDQTQNIVRDSITLLHGPEVNARLMELAGTGPIEVRLEAIAALAARGVLPAVPLLLQTLDAPESQIQQAAISALRTMASTKQYPELLQRALAAKSDTSRQRLQDLLVALYGRSAAPQECIEQVVAALPAATAEGKSLLLGILGPTGDPEAFKVLDQMLGSSDIELCKAALRAFAQWPDAAPLPRLTDILRKSDQLTIKVLAIRTILAILGKEKTLVDPQKTAMLAQLLDLAPRPDEKRLVIAMLPKAGNAESLQLAAKLLDDPQLANEAAAAIAAIASRRSPPPQTKAALEKASQVTKSPVILKQIRERMKTL